MCAWPVATMRWAPGSAGRASAPRDSGPCRHGRIVTPAGRSGEDVERPHDGDAQPSTSGIVDLQGPHHAVEHVEVVDECLGIGVDPHQFGADEAVQRGVAGGVRGAQRRGLELRERRVGRRFDDELDGAGTALDRHRLAAGVHALQRAALGIADEALALEAGGVEPEAEVDQRLDSAPGPRRRHVSREPEPRRAPRLPPPVADGERLQVLDRRAGLDVQRAAVGVDQRQHPLGQLTGDPLLDEHTVVVHRAILDVPPPDSPRRLRRLTASSQQILSSALQAHTMTSTTPPPDDHDGHDEHDRGLQFDMSTLLARRRLLGAVAGAGIATLVAACSNGDDSSGATAPSTTSPSVSTSAATDSTTATTAPASTASTASTHRPQRPHPSRRRAARRSLRRPPGRSRATARTDRTC